jgi:glycosyltransferase involved in cell wall biosynthesis
MSANLKDRHLALVQSKVKLQPTVLQVCATLGFGGSERIALQAAEALQEAGGRSLISGAPGIMVDEIVARNIKFCPLPAEGYSPLNILSNIGRIARLIKEENVDVVHIHNRAPGWSALLAARRTKTPTVSTYHSAYGMGFALKRRFNSVMASADRVIISSNYIGGYMDAHHGPDPQRRVLIRNGMDLVRFDPQNVSKERIDSLKRAWGIPEHRPIFVLPARFTRLKGHSVVIEAIAQLQKWGLQDFLCLFVGDDRGRDPFRQELEQKMAQLGVCDLIRFAGATSDMPAVYALADFSLSSSLHSENLSLALIEASAMGLPVIATRLGAAGEVIAAPPTVAPEERTGWFVQPGNVMELAQAMRGVLQLSPAEKERIGRRARLRMMTEFDVRTSLQRTLSLYQELSGSQHLQNNVNAA